MMGRFCSQRFPLLCKPRIPLLRQPLLQAFRPQATLAASQMPFMNPMQQSEIAKMKMWCAQCAQSKDSRGCFASVGVCRKTAKVAAQQDELILKVKQIAYGLNQLENANISFPGMVARMHYYMFTTLTNVNNDPVRFEALLQEADEHLTTIKALDMQQVDMTLGSLPQKLVDRGNITPGYENVECLREMLEGALKGICAYTDHAAVGGVFNSTIDTFVVKALAYLAEPNDGDLGRGLSMCLEAGEVNVLVMEKLYEANKHLGVPEPTEVSVKPQPGKCILVSGHDLHMLDSLLQACEKYEAFKGEPINVYTHGEMLPAHSYPELKKFKCLVGHFGGAWNRQHHEFKHFPGAIVMSSNCLTVPLNKYKSNVFTFGPVGWEDVPHLGDNLEKTIDWNQVIDCALANDGFKQGVEEFGYDAVSKLGQPSPKNVPQMVGFGHEVLIANAGTVLAGIEAGLIKRFYVIGGCDGDEENRDYYTQLAMALPKESVVLTLGCGKFRISDEARARLGTIGDTGIPRVLDIGQCNDTFSAVQVAVALANALDCKVSDLPLSIVLCWLEQKAIAVLLSCMHLGLKPLRVGPTLPAFATNDVLNVLVNDFGLKVVSPDIAKEIEEMEKGC